MSAPKPVYAVWEITLACDLACRHCGSRAGKRRDRELSTDEALRVVDGLARIGVEQCSLIGGEFYLRGDWETILRALSDRRIRPSLVTGGRRFTRDVARRAKEAGVETVSVSVDGLEETHDLLRGRKGSWRAALEAIDHLRAEGVRAAANTQVNRLNFGELDALCGLLLERGVRGWQVQLTAALGRAADWPEMLLQPYDVLEVVPKIADLKERCAAAGCELMPGSSVGYFGPHESRLRTNAGRPTHWQGCGAGCETLGIESDGTFKGCPSLPTRGYAAGDLKSDPVEAIWESSPVLERHRATSREDLWGFCRSCYYADVCRGGCTFTAHSLLGRPGNMPYCWHRADALAARGVREVLVPAQPAPGRPFDHGRFDLREEPIPSVPVPLETRRDQILKADGSLPGVPAARVRFR